MPDKFKKSLGDSLWKEPPIIRKEHRTQLVSMSAICSETLEKKLGRLQREELPTFRVMKTHTKATITTSAWFMETLKKRATNMVALRLKHDGSISVAPKLLK